MSTLELITREGCPHCVAAVNLLESKNVTFTHTALPNTNEAKDPYKEKYNHRTFPMIVVDGVFKGGNDTLQAMNKNGELDKILNT